VYSRSVDAYADDLQVHVYIHVDPIQLNALCTLSVYLRQLWLISRSLTVDTAHTLVRALIHSRLDHCNALFAGFPVSVDVAAPQSVLKAAARFVVRLPGRVSVSATTALAQRITCNLFADIPVTPAAAYLWICVPTASVTGQIG